ncbi:MAG: DUF4386 domain-containing protein, partial [Pseudomonadota bacterium]
ALGGLGYLVDSVRAFAFPETPLLPQLGLGLLLIATVAELSFAVMLCLRRSNRPRMRAQLV